MEKLTALYKSCKNSVSVEINRHRDYYESVETYLNNYYDSNEIGSDVINKMIELDTIIEIQFYPNTAIGFYTIFHYDLDMALDKCFELLKIDLINNH